MLTTRIAYDLGVKVGDSVDVETALGKKAFAVGGLTTELSPSYAFMSMAELPGWDGAQQPVFNFAYLPVDAGRGNDIERAI